MFTLAGHRRAVRAVAFAPGPTPLLASAGDDGFVFFWDALARRELGLRESRRDGLLCLAFAPDGALLASGGRAGTLLIWDVATQTRLPASTACGGRVVAVAFTADGGAILAGLRTLRYGGAVGRLVCLNVRPSHAQQPLDWDGDLESAAVAPSRDLIAVAGLHRGVELVQIGRPRQEPVLWAPCRVRALCFSPGAARRLAIASGHIVQVFDVEQVQVTAVCQGHRADVNAVAFSPDGRLLLSGGADRSTRLWDAASGRQIASWDWQLGAVNAVAVSPDGMLAAAGCDKPTVVVWDLDDG